MTTPNPYASVPATGGAVPLEQKTNMLAIIGLVLSVIGINVIGIVLGFVAMNQIKKTGEKGRGLAIAAVIVGFVEIIIFFIVVIVSIVAASTMSVYSY